MEEPATKDVMDEVDSGEEEFDAGQSVDRFSTLAWEVSCNPELDSMNEVTIFNGKFGGKSVSFYNRYVSIECTHHSYVKVKKESIGKDAVSELQQLLELRKFHQEQSDKQSMHFAHLFGCFLDQPSQSYILVFDSCYEHLSERLSYPMHEELRHSVCRDICRGMSFLHTFNPQILHGAVVPHSIVLNQWGYAKLAGLSRAYFFRRKWRRLCRKQKDAYTALDMLFMSPELVKSKAIDEKHDIFCFAVSVMYILTGSTPNPKGKIGTEETTRRDENIDVLTRRCPQYLEIVKKCLQKRPKDRPTAQEVLVALLNIQKLDAQLSSLHSSGKFSRQSSGSDKWLPGMTLHTLPPDKRDELSPLQYPPSGGGNLVDAIFVRPFEPPPPIPDTASVEQCVKLKFTGALVKFNESGFIPGRDYNKQKINGSFHLISLNSEDMLGESRKTSLDSNISELFIMHELNRDNLPQNMMKMYNTLSKPGGVHRNVSSILGAVVDRDPKESATVTRIFEEFTDNCLTEYLEHPNYRPASFNVVVKWMYQLFDALEYAHGHGLVHGRLYGNCVRISGPSCELKISFLMDNDSYTDVTDIKYLYRSPEYFKNHAHTHSSDVWMAACNVVLMVTRRHPLRKKLTKSDVESKIEAMQNSPDKGVFYEFVHGDILKEELHSYQWKGLESLFKAVFLCEYSKRPSAKNVLDQYLHCCSDKSEPKLLLSVQPDLPVPFTTVMEETAYCCCWSAADSTHMHLDKRLIKKMAGLGIAVKIDLLYIICGGIHHKEGKNTGPAVFFNSPVMFEVGTNVRVQIPLYGTRSTSPPLTPEAGHPPLLGNISSKSEEDQSVRRISQEQKVSQLMRSRYHSYSHQFNDGDSSASCCKILPFVGEYSSSDNLYMFKRDYLVKFSDSDPSRLLVHVSRTMFLQPVCLCSGHRQEDCPVYSYEVRGYWSKDAVRELDKEIEGEAYIVVVIKSSSWEKILDDQFPSDEWLSTKEVIHTQHWEKIDVNFDSKNLTKQSSIRRSDVDDINDKPLELHEKVEQREYPARVGFTFNSQLSSTIKVTIPGCEERDCISLKISVGSDTPFPTRWEKLPSPSVRENEYSLDSKPSERHLLKHVIEPLGIERAKFCIYLGLKLNRVEVAKQAGNSDTDYLNVMKPWLNGKLAPTFVPTWDSVVKALKETGQVRYAEKLEADIIKKNLS